MYRNLVSCQDLRAGMRVTRRVVCGDFLLADEGAVLTEPLIRLFSFLGVRRVAVDKTARRQSPLYFAAAGR